MLGQKTPKRTLIVSHDDLDDVECYEEPDLLRAWVDTMSAKARKIYSKEMDIDREKTLYLITWAPDPKHLPDADFGTQHQYFISIIADYLKCCKTGLFCVEATQIGNPHYHGWYQVKDKYEEGRVVMMKVLQKFGNVKVTTSKGHYKVNSYSDKANCLYYYKKDVFDAMYFNRLNPINKYSESAIPWNEYSYFFNIQGRHTSADIQDKISLKEFYKNFYANSL